MAMTPYLDFLDRVHRISAEVGLAEGRVVADLARVDCHLELPKHEGKMVSHSIIFKRKLNFVDDNSSPRQLVPRTTRG